MTWIIILAVLLAAFVAFVAFWTFDRFRNLMADSETILWARLQTMAGAIAAAITFVDPTLLAGVLPGEWLPWVLLGNGIATEFLRRMRASDL